MLVVGEVVISGAGTTVGFVIVELLGAVVLLPILRQPAKSVAVNTKINTIMLIFFISNPPESQNAKLVFPLRTILLCELLYKNMENSKNILFRDCIFAFDGL